MRLSTHLRKPSDLGARLKSASCPVISAQIRPRDKVSRSSLDRQKSTTSDRKVDGVVGLIPNRTDIELGILRAIDEEH